jgi:hypothetical protein
MNIRTLENKPEKLQECLNLIEKSFEYDSSYSFKEDFSLLINESNYKNCFFIEQESKVTATVFTLPRVLEFKSIETPVLFIGGISVDQDAQGQGLFRELFETVITLNGSYALYFLWSDLSSLYEKFNFYEFGEISEKESRNSNQIAELSYENFLKLEKEYQSLSQRFVLPKRKLQDWKTLWSTSSIDKKVDENGNVIFINKGMDLQGIIHECYPISAENNTSYTMWNFDKNDDKNVMNRYMGFARLGNIEVLSTFIKAISKNQIEINSTEHNILNISYLGDPYNMSEKDFIQGLWGPGKIEEWNDIIPKILIFGFDSI